MMRRKKKQKSCSPFEDERQKQAHDALEKLGTEAAREILALEYLRLRQKEAKPT